MTVDSQKTPLTQAQDIIDSPKALQVPNQQPAIHATQKFRKAVRVVQANQVVLKFMQERSKQFAKNTCADTGFVSMFTCICYGAVDFAKGPVSLLISVHLVNFYQSLGVSLGSMAFFMALARCIDVLSDPIMANITDATRSSFGRRRPYMLVGAFFYGGALVGLCWPPKTLATTWFGVFYIGFFLTSTFANLPHDALGQEVTTNPEQRRKLFMVAKMFEGLGTLLAAVLPALLTMLLRRTEGCAPGLEKSICDQQLNYTSIMITGFVFGGWALLSMLICVVTIKEKDVTAQADASDNGPSKLEEVIPNFISMLKNRPFRAMMVPWIFDSTLAALLASMLPFFVQYVIIPERLCVERSPILPETAFVCSDMNVLAMGLVGLLLTAMLSMPMWFAIARRVGDYKAWLAFNMLNALTNVLLIFPSFGWENRTFLIVATVSFSVVNGLPLGAKFLTDNILGLCIDYDELRNGVRSEASFTMFATFIPKVVSIPASTFPLTILALLDFKKPSLDGTPDLHQSSAIMWSIRVMFAVVPFMLACGSCWIKYRLFPFKDIAKADAEIKTGLQRRGSRKPYVDPLDQKWVRPSESEPPAEWKRALALLNHFSGVEIVQEARRRDSDRGAVFRRKAKLELALVLLFLAVSTAGAVVALLFGLLDDDSWSWVPSLLVLFVGLGALFSLLALLRVLAACKLGDPCDGLLDFVIRERERLEASHIDDVVQEEAEDMRNNFLQASKPNGIMTKAMLRKRLHFEREAREKSLLDPADCE